MADSFWLREAKDSLRCLRSGRGRDPVDAANDAEALAQWADLHCGGILQTTTDAIHGAASHQAVFSQPTVEGDQNG